MTGAGPLAALLDSRSIAVVGASARPGSSGQRVMQHLAAAGYQGEVVPVSRRAGEIGGRRAYTSLSAYPGEIEHAVLLVPAEMLHATILDAAEKKVQAVSVFAAGFAETGTEGKQHQASLTALAAAGGIRLLGPNSLGVINAHTGLVATATSALETLALTPGAVSVVSQSGAVGMHFVALLAQSGLGLRYYVSTGNEADVSAGEVLDHVAADDATDVVLLYLEGIRDPERFCAALTRLAGTGKTAIAIKVGRTPRGTAAVASHTAALAGNDAVYDAVLRRLGVLRVDSLPEAVSAASMIVSGSLRRRRPQGVAVVSISGGLGALMAEDLETRGFELPVPSTGTQAGMRDLVPFCTPGNPIDVTGQITAEPEKLAAFLQLATRDPRVDAVAVLLSYTVLVPRVFDVFRQALLAQASGDGALMLVEGLLDDAQRRDLASHGIVVARDTRELARLLDLLRQLGDARGTRGAYQPGRPGLAAETTLPDGEAMTRMARAGVPMAPWLAVDGPAEAPTAAGKLGGRVALKLLVPGVLHKAKAGLVRTDVQPGDAAAVAARLLEDRPPGVQLIAQAMAPPGWAEVILGARRDETFGLVCLIGRGGVAAEENAASAVLLPPLTQADMTMALSGLGQPAWIRPGAGLDKDALWHALRSLHDLVAADPAISDAEINPVLVGPPGAGALAVDAVIRYGPGQRDRASALARTDRSAPAEPAS